VCVPCVRSGGRRVGASIRRPAAPGGESPPATDHYGCNSRNDPGTGLPLRFRPAGRSSAARARPVTKASLL